MGLLNIFGSIMDKIQKMEKNNDIVGILEILNKNIEKNKETAYECALTLGRLKNINSVKGIIDIMNAKFYDMELVLDHVNDVNIMQSKYYQMSSDPDGTPGATWIVSRIYLTDNGLTDGMFELSGRCLGGAIAWALGEIGDKQAIPVLIKVLSERTGNTTYKMEAIKALAKINDKQAEDVLIKLINDNFGDDIVKAQAAKTLGILGSTKAVDALIASLATSNPKPSSKKRLYNPACLGCCAAEALGNIGGKKALNALINWQMSTFEHPYAIITALGKIPDKRAIGALKRTLQIAENDNDIDLQNLVKELIQKIETN